MARVLVGPTAEARVEANSQSTALSDDEEDFRHPLQRQREAFADRDRPSEILILEYYKFFEARLEEEKYEKMGGDYKARSYWSLPEAQKRGTVVCGVRFRPKTDPLYWEADLPKLEGNRYEELFARGAEFYISKTRPDVDSVRHNKVWWHRVKIRERCRHVLVFEPIHWKVPNDFEDNTRLDLFVDLQQLNGYCNALWDFCMVSPESCSFWLLSLLSNRPPSEEALAHLCVDSSSPIGLNEFELADVLEKFCNQLRLNPLQMQVARGCLQNRLYLVQGPPGTGKTTLCVALLGILQSFGKILVCSESNQAVDNILDRVRQRSRELFKGCVRTGNVEAMSDVGKEREIKRLMMEERGYLESKQLHKYAKKALNEDAARMFQFTTLGSIALRIPKELRYPVVMVDEAAQCMEPAMCPAMMKVGEKFVLVGDHKQLSATVESQAARAHGLEMSVFERLFDDYPTTGKVTLEEQYRMVPEICCLISDRFYQGVLRSCVAPRRSPLKDVEGNLLFVHVCGSERTSSQGKYYNDAEIDVIFDILHQILKEQEVSSADIGVICMYRQQVKRLLERKPSSLPFLNVSTVDGFQGAEREVMFLSMVRSNPSGACGFSTDPRRVNVALSRAKSLLVCVGNAPTFYWGDNSHGHVFALLEHAAAHRSLLDRTLQPVHLQDIVRVDSKPDIVVEPSAKSQRVGFAPRPLSQSEQGPPFVVPTVQSVVWGDFVLREFVSSAEDLLGTPLLAVILALASQMEFKTKAWGDHADPQTLGIKYVSNFQEMKALSVYGDPGNANMNASIKLLLWQANVVDAAKQICQRCRSFRPFTRPEFLLQDALSVPCMFALLTSLYPALDLKFLIEPQSLHGEEQCADFMEFVGAVCREDHPVCKAHACRGNA